MTPDVIPCYHLLPCGCRCMEKAGHDRSHQQVAGRFAVVRFLRSRWVRPHEEASR